MEPLPATARSLRRNTGDAALNSSNEPGPTTSADDALWSAIGDPTRRRLLDLLLADNGGTATSLGRQLPVTRQAVAKHLGVLDRTGLVRSSSAGRERRYQVDEVQLARAVAQLSAVRSAWETRLQRIRRIAETIQQTSDSDLLRHDQSD
ncbi:ArsR/SmtB family transcription factor [Myceligenerans indicum]|uniref:Helix-turn-helix transcriptional regulator n=1 Tax=Myceligenerans indicum TaxID=2593663 RepID=A0ABS1LRS8_9MICO|nr:helix-turn-helix domain-containing protein [Myceligenerans indicum]MBL0888900.1 helix-turn-helix transcriptional regulator [Myceligenerans indicum]